MAIIFYRVENTMNVTVFVHSRSLYIIFTNSCVRTKTVVTLQKVYHTHLVSIGFGTKVMQMWCQCIKAYHNIICLIHKHTNMYIYIIYVCIYDPWYCCSARKLYIGWKYTEKRQLKVPLLLDIILFIVWDCVEISLSFYPEGQ